MHPSTPEPTAATSSSSPEESAQAHLRERRTSAVDPAGRPQPSFEQRRAIEVARERLFGVSSALRIGRFVVEGRLGVGGMGEVYLAVDEELGRKVAIKWVLPLLDDDREGDPPRQRLRREARALAKLSHPNVVQIYELGEHDGRTFLAMEYVDGQTLGQWLTSSPRRWPEVLERFIDAGRGLAAAHAAGVIHRDFKPDNVLIGRDGRVRVADFGLATADPTNHEQVVTEDHPADSPLTSTGAVLGTIRYMPLEQLRGEPVDERSDQFAFCVALFEALWRYPPFEASSALARREALEQGQPFEPHGSVPAYLWRVIRRGLARDPAQRWPDMDSMLDALRGRRFSRTLLAVAALAATAALGSSLWPSHSALGPIDVPDPVCVPEDGLVGIWDPSRREALAARFEASAASHATASRDRVLSNLDDWADGWTEQRRALCAAEREHPNDAVFDDQATCLSIGRRRMDGLVQMLLDERPDDESGDALVGAVDLSFELQDPQRCADEHVVRVIMPPPEIREEAEVLWAEVLRIHDLRTLGRLDEAQSLFASAQSRADVLGHGPLIAETFAERALLELARGSIDRGTSLFLTAIDLAERNRHELLTAQLRTQGAIFVAKQMKLQVASRAHMEAAAFSWEQVGPLSREQALQAYARGLVVGLLDETAAEAELRTGLDAIEGIDAPERVFLYSAIAEGLRAREPMRALENADRAVQAAVSTWGPEHPSTEVFRERRRVLKLDLPLR